MNGTEKPREGYLPEIGSLEANSVLALQSSQGVQTLILTEKRWHQ